MAKDYQKLLNDVFGYKGKEEIKAPIEPINPVETPIQAPPVQKKQPVTRDTANIDGVANVQSVVWGAGNPPPPKAPNARMQDAGIAPALSNQEGWGKV